MTDLFGKSLLAAEPMTRLGVFLVALLAMAGLEAVWPRRHRLLPRALRWVTNFTFVGLGAAVVRVLAALGASVGVPLVAVAAALFAERQGIGLLHWTAWPLWVEALISILVLDFAIWFQHVAAHRVDMLWLVHRMHHVDREIDVSTALRFHPIEIGLSMLWKVVWVLALGAPAMAVMSFEIILNALAMFNHANVALPPWLDRVLRPIIVTPDMHRVHHSVLPREHNANFGFNLSLWDRLFGTYVAEPRDGHEDMTIGLADQQTEAPTRLLWSLKYPFRR